ncbi:MAG TPA: GDSL-type esterase/lipase family protein [Phycisphaerae bacterium]|nr:GDSL-type esterase/lipase family protein [Phycisphaerae bacterium]
MKRLMAMVAAASMMAAAWTTMGQTAAPAAPGAAPGQRGGARGGFGAPGRGRGFAPVVIGPSAPVPPEVAIPRPSAEELQRINSAIENFVAHDTSPDKPLLEKYQSLLVVQAPRLNTAATYTQTPQRMGPRHEGFVERAKQGDIDLLLEGDSITDWWTQTPEKKAMFDKYFKDIKTANFAIAGDTTQGNLWGLKNGEGEGFSPKAIMLMIGTNNMGTNTAPEIAEGVGAVVLELRKDFPNAKILLLAIFPRSTPGDPIREKVAETNKIIARLNDDQHVFYMDIGPKFLDDKGAFLPDAFQGDMLHPTATGYDLWGAAVQDKLAELMK